MNIASVLVNEIYIWILFDCKDKIRMNECIHLRSPSKIMCMCRRTFHASQCYGNDEWQFKFFSLELITFKVSVKSSLLRVSCVWLPQYIIRTFSSSTQLENSSQTEQWSPYLCRLCPVRFWRCLVHFGHDPGTVLPYQKSSPNHLFNNSWTMIWPTSFMLWIEISSRIKFSQLWNKIWFWANILFICVFTR